MLAYIPAPWILWDRETHERPQRTAQTLPNVAAPEAAGTHSQPGIGKEPWAGQGWYVLGVLEESSCHDRSVKHAEMRGMSIIIINHINLISSYNIILYCTHIYIIYIYMNMCNLYVCVFIRVYSALLFFYTIYMIYIYIFIYHYLSLLIIIIMRPFGQPFASLFPVMQGQRCLASRLTGLTPEPAGIRLVFTMLRNDYLEESMVVDENRWIHSPNSHSNSQL